MLERIERIHGVGLLHSVNGKPFKFYKNQLIYAENGRGKSTLASVLRSVSSGDPKSILERKTIDAATPQLVDLLFENGQKVNFDGANWSTSRPEMVVFDADFVEANVHSGGTVTPNQRKSLLSFALGTKAVKAQADENQASSAATAASARVTQITQQLSGYHAGLALTHFIKLPKDPDAENKIGELQKRLR